MHIYLILPLLQLGDASAQLDKVKTHLSESTDKVTAQLAARTDRAKEALTQQSERVFEELNDQLDKEGVAEAPEVSPDSLAVMVLQQLTPPVPIALVVALLRAVPTLIVFALSELAGAYQVLFLKQSPRAVLFPLILLPFAAAELVALVRRGGAGNVFRLSMNKDTDGLAVLLWYVT
jgi:hypothetical protein